MSNDFPLGGDSGLVDPSPKRSRGVYAGHPASTPKYHTGNGTDSVARQARFYIDFPDRESFLAYRRQIPERARKLVEVLSPQSAIGGVGYVDFLLSRIDESLQEKFQISEVLSDSYAAYFFGQKAPMWAMQGVFLNTVQDPWYDAFHILYTDVLRGSKLAQHKVPLRLVYDNREIIGSLLAVNTALEASNEQKVDFSAQFLVREIRIRRYDDILPTHISYTGQDDRDALFEGTERVYTELFTDLEAAREEREQTAFRQGVTDDIAERLEANLQRGVDFIRDAALSKSGQRILRPNATVPQNLDNEFNHVEVDPWN